jgi:hypothetical protein
VLLACASSFIGPKIVVAGPLMLNTPLSAVRFDSVDVTGSPSDIVHEINAAMKKAGYPLGLSIGLPGEGQRVYESTRLRLDGVTLREAIDRMCVQLRISYWDNERLRELYFYDGERTSFFTEIRGKDGKYIPAGPPQFAPEGFDELPLREAYFDRTIKDLAEERGLLPQDPQPSRLQ